MLKKKIRFFLKWELIFPMPYPYRVTVVILHGRFLSHDCNSQHDQAIRIQHHALPIIVPRVIYLKKEKVRGERELQMNES